MSGVTVDLTVDSIAVGGSGVGRTEEGQVVFVPRTAPGDRVRAELLERRRRWARGRVVQIVEPGPDRVEPTCGLFDECGGCQLQHLSTAAQHAWLRRAVADTLARIGGASVPVEETIAGGRRFGYRNRVTFTLRRDRGRVSAGYRGVRGGRLVEVDRCPLAEAPVQDAWKALRASWGSGAKHLPPGGELRLTLRASDAGEVGLLVTGGRGDVAPDPAPIMSGVPGLATYWWVRGDGTRRRIAGAETLRDRWDDVELGLWPEAFLQVNREVAGLIESHLDAGIGELRGTRIFDLYAGVGLRAIRWAARGADVVAVEASGDAVRTGRAAAATGAGEPSFVEDTVEAALPTLGRADAIVVNPPRAGLGREAVERLRAADADRLVYVSCDPATLARDVARLDGAWVPERAHPFDAFPQTGHVETVLWLRRDGARGASARDGERP